MFRAQGIGPMGRRVQEAQERLRRSSRASETSSLGAI